MKINIRLWILLIICIVVTLLSTQSCSHSWQTVRAFPSQMIVQEQQVVAVSQLNHSHNHNHFVIHKDKNTSWHLVYDKSSKNYFFMTFIIQCSDNKLKPMYMTIDSTTLEFQYNQNELISNNPDCYIFVLASSVSDSTLLIMLETQGISMLSVISEDNTLSLSIPPGVKHIIKKEFGFSSSL
ncbi:hypothetical protein LCGC14_2534280 [marine sediment metagenome]|uniref:Uncharacterized protein n=1 Tax=marine sediment metagenome TaxID=412755 RepID=A0A0F9D437_9ZZZZ